MNLDLRVISLLANFNQKLSALLDDSECDHNHLSKDKSLRRIEGKNDSDTDSRTKIGKGDLSSDIWSKVSQISQLATELTCNPLANLTSQRKKKEEWCGSPEHLEAPVIVIGPPGTEPRMGLSNARFDNSQSVVYSRSSIQLPMSRQYLPVEDIPPKDRPRPRAEVVTFFRNDEDYDNRRWTRSDTRNMKYGVRSVKSLYSEQSSESESSDEQEMREYRPRHRSTKSERGQLHTRGQRIDPQAHITSTGGKNGGKVPCHTSAPFRQPLDHTLNTACSTPTGSSNPTPLEDLDEVVQVSTFDITETSEDYETPPEYPLDFSDHADFETQGPECLPVPTIATTSTKMDSGLSTPSSEMSPTPSPSILRSESTPSGIRTVLNELQANYSTGMKPKKLLKLSTSKSMKGGGFVYHQQKSLKDCSVVVERLPWKVVEQHGGARPDLKATKERGGERERESSLDSDMTIGSFHRSGDEMDLGYSVPQISVKPEPKLGLGSTAREKKLKTEATHPKKIASFQKASFPKISLAVSSRLKGPKQDWSSESDFDIPPSSQLRESSGLKKSISSHKRSNGGGVSGRKGEEKKEAVVHGKLGKNDKSPKGKDKMSRGLSLPEDIDCTGCGKGIHWSDQPIHSHPRLKVLICMDCLNKFRNGTFTVEEGSEIYCTLCGDGGNLVCCDTCDKSFCQNCIARTAGKGYLKKILSPDTDWNCFMCDSSPLSMQQMLCEALCDYYRNRPHRRKQVAKKKLGFGSDSGDSSHSSESSSHSSNPSYPSDSSGNGGNGGAAGTSTSGFSPNRKSSRRINLGSSPGYDGGGDQEMDGGGSKGKGSQGDKQSSKSGGGKGKGSSGVGAGKGGGGENRSSGSSGKRGGGDRRRSSLWQDSSSESDSNHGSSDSLEVNTDDVSMSDSSLFDSDCGVHKKKRSRKQQRQREAQPANPGTDSDTSGDPGREPQSLSVSSTVSATVKPGQVDKRRKKRMSRLSSSVLSDSDFEGQPFLSQKKNPKKRPLSMSSASSSDGKMTRKKKSRFASALSSGSESENERWNLRSKLSDDDDDGGRVLHSPSPSMVATPLRSDRAINYATRSKVGSSSDSDCGFLGRARGSKKRIQGLLSSKDQGEGRKPQRKKLKRAAFRSSDDDNFEDLSLRGPRLKRRVRKSVLTSDSEMDSEQEAEVKREDKGESSSSAENSQEGSPDKTATPGKKRKKIRKLITDSKLAVDTKTAQRLERERMERLKKRAKLLGDSDTKNEARLILEQDEETKEVRLEVRRSLVRHIKPHQREGIKFLYDAVVENLNKTGERGGAVLAHCMGLGKSLQVIAFIDALLNCQESGISRVLILSPVNTIHNWMNEFNLWIPYSKCDYNIFLMTSPGTKQRHHRLRRWFDGGGIMFIGYDMFRNLAQGKHMKRKAQKEDFQKFLLDPGPDLVVCDEGHVMRNSKSNISLVLNQVRTLGRIVLTGTPLQNNLLEYYTMVSFVKPNLLGTIREFKNRFVNPITNGQCQDSTPYDVRRMKLRAHILHELLVGSVQRRDYRVLAECLPPKQEYVLNIRLSPVQDQLYRRFLDKGSGYHTSSDLFSTFTTLQKVWNHPWVLKLDEQRQNERAERLAMYGESDDSLGGFIVSGSEEEEEEDDEEEEEVRKKAMKKKKKKKCGSSLASSRSSSVCSAHPSNLHSRSTTPSNDVIILSSSNEDNDIPCIVDCNIKSVKSEDVTLPDSTSSSIPGPSGVQPAQPVSLRPESPPLWYHDLLSEECETRMDMSGKLLFLFELLQEAEKLKEKVLVFTQSLLTLDIIEMFLNKQEFGDWTPGIDYYRLDGSTKSDIRTSYMAEFNAKNNNRMRLFLISTRAGSLGVNLVAANRVVIFDACWNPSHDLQAVFRTYRFGQTKPIFVYRLLAQGTMEEKIYDRQVTKQSLSMRVVDEKQIGRHYTASDLAELFTYSPPPLAGTQLDKPYERPEADMVLCSILDRLQPQWIVNYHEHDSLLEHVFDEELTEEERKAAWEKYKADMAAESVQYNYQALQNRLEEEQMEQRAQVQQMQQMILDQSNSATASNSGVGSILYKLSNAVALVNSLTNLKKNRDILVRHLSNNQVQHPPHLNAQLQEVELRFQEGSYKLGDAIQQVNMLISQFQSSNHTSTFPPSFSQMVNSLHMTFLNQLEALKQSTRVPTSSIPSHPPYVSTSHVLPPPPNVTPQDVFQRTMPPTHTPAHLLPHSHTQNLKFQHVTGL